MRLLGTFSMMEGDFVGGSSKAGPRFDPPANTGAGIFPTNIGAGTPEGRQLVSPERPLASETAADRTLGRPRTTRSNANRTPPEPAPKNAPDRSRARALRERRLGAPGPSKCTARLRRDFSDEAQGLHRLRHRPPARSRMRPAASRGRPPAQGRRACAPLPLRGPLARTHRLRRTGSVEARR